MERWKIAARICAATLAASLIAGAVSPVSAAEASEEAAAFL